MLGHRGPVGKQEGAVPEHGVAVPACPAVIGDAQGEHVPRFYVPSLPPQEQNPASLGAANSLPRLSLIGFFTPPSVLGIPELFEKGKRPFPLIAQTRCRLIEINTNGCRQRLLNDARFLQSGCSMALKQNVAQNVHYINLTAYPVRNNLAECLLQLQRDGIVTIKYTELSEYLVVSYRHLMYVIRELCGEGILQRISKGFRILDMARLRALAEEIGEESLREEKEPEESPSGGNRRSHL